VSSVNCIEDWLVEWRWLCGGDWDELAARVPAVKFFTLEGFSEVHSIVI
jgi:hypothetical protein